MYLSKHELHPTGARATPKQFSRSQIALYIEHYATSAQISDRQQSM